MGPNDDGDGTSDDDLEFRASATPGLLVHNWLEPDTGDVVYEGATDDAYNLKFRIVDPTGLRTCLAGDDDFNGTGQSQLVAVPIAAEQTLLVVASTFSSGAAIGAYTIDVATD